MNTRVTLASEYVWNLVLAFRSFGTGAVYLGLVRHRFA